MDIKCKTCGTIYRDGIDISNSTNVTLGNNYTKCPRCGTMNKGIEGTFDFDKQGNIIRDYLQNVGMTAIELSQLKQVLQSINVGTSIDSASIAIETVSPKLSGFLKTFSSKLDQYGGLVGFIALMITIIQWITPIDQATPVVNNIINNYNSPSETSESFTKKTEKDSREKRLRDIKNKQAQKDKLPTKKTKRN